MEAERKALTEDLKAIRTARDSAWVEAQNTWDSDTNEFRVAIVTAGTAVTAANTKLDDVKEAVAKWNLRPAEAVTVANDEDTTTYDIVYQGETLTGVTNA
jgi:hypothetical protein